MGKSKSKLSRSKREEQQGKKVIRGIVIVCLIIAIIFISLSFLN